MTIIPRRELLATLRETLEDVDTALARFDLERSLEQLEIQGT